MKKLKLTLAIKVLFVIWLSSYLVNMASSSSGLYSIGSIGFKHLVNSISQSSGELMSVSGLLLYPIVLLWSILNYQKIKRYTLKLFDPLITAWKAKREINELKIKQDSQKKTTAKEKFGYACLFLAGMLLVDTFLYDSMTSFFVGSTQSQAMPKRASFFLMLIIFHKYRSVVLVMFLISVCVYGVLWLTERRKLSK